MLCHSATFLLLQSGNFGETGSGESSTTEQRIFMNHNSQHLFNLLWVAGLDLDAGRISLVVFNDGISDELHKFLQLHTSTNLESLAMVHNLGVTTS